MKPTEMIVIIQPLRKLKRKKIPNCNKLYFEITSLSTALSTIFFSIAKPYMMKAVSKSTSMETVSRAAHLTAVRQP